MQAGLPAPEDFPRWRGKIAFGTDGSESDGRAGLGVFFGSLPNGAACKWDLASFPRNQQSIANAEVIAIEAALHIVPAGPELIAVIDSQFVFDSLWSWATKPEKEKRRAMYQLAFDRIHHLVWQKHHGKLASNLVSDERKARIRANLSSLGNAAVYFKMLNEGGRPR
jgi:hypothetical protein